MTSNIYLIQDDGTLRAMKEEPYGSEDLLQTLLEKYPEILAGEQVSPAKPVRWLLVSREIGVPGEQGGSDRWSLDHLFLDSEGIPTLVEVKTSSDTRIRREVVGQMLDYAANAVVYWPAERIRATFETRCEEQGKDPAQLVIELTEDQSTEEDPIETFWSRVKTNLQAGRVRMVFIADEIPPELRRIVEFLNSQMDPAEVLAVEVRQFVGERIKTLVPKVIGQTAAAEQVKGRRETRQWDEESFFNELAASHNDDVTVARAIFDWIKPRFSRIWWGQGKHHGSWVPTLQVGKRKYQFFAVWTTGAVEIYFQHLQDKPAFNSEEKRSELLNRLNRIPRLGLSPDLITKRPQIPLSLLRDMEGLRAFQEAIEWAIGEAKLTLESS